jgi:hypothetical protein
MTGRDNSTDRNRFGAWFGLACETPPAVARDLDARARGTRRHAARPNGLDCRRARRRGHNRGDDNDARRPTDDARRRDRTDHQATEPNLAEERLDVVGLGREHGFAVLRGLAELA